MSPTVIHVAGTNLPAPSSSLRGWMFRAAGQQHGVRRAARRPAYAVLDLARLEAHGITMPHWRDALTRYLTSIGYGLAGHATPESPTPL